MAAGIFFFDRFLPDTSVLLVCYALFSLVLLLPASGFLKYKRTTSTYLFGSVVSVCFFLLGGISVLYERNSIEYQWSDKECLYYGKVVTPPEKNRKSFSSTVHVEAVMNGKDSSFIPVNRDILLYWLRDSLCGKSNVKCGDKLLFYSKVSEPVSDVEFMGFDYRRYLSTKGISGTAFSFQSDMLFQNDVELSLKAKALQCRDSIVSVFSGWELEDRNIAVVSALTIGDKSGLTPEIKDMYNVAGTSHVLALSGLHVGIFSAILYFLLWPLKKVEYGHVLQSVAVVLVLWTFAFVSGLSPSVVRAVTMCSLYFLASLFVENGLPGVYSLTFTAFIMLLYQPLYLFDISFRLSFVAVLSIVLFFPYFNSLVKSNNKFVKYLWGTLSVSMSAQLGTMPFILYYFGSFPVYFLLANLIVSPLAACILSLTLASLLLAWIPYVGDFCIYVLNLATGALNASMDYICNLDGAQVTSIYVDEMQMTVMFAMIVCSYLYLRRRRPCFIIAMLCCMCFIFGAGYYKRVNKESPALFLAWSGLYLKDGRRNTELVSDNGIFSINRLSIGIMKTGHWKNNDLMPGEQPLHLDYTYFCRGFKGDLKSLSKIFKIDSIVIDASLGEYYKNMVIEQSKELDIPICANSGQASYKIVL